MSKFGSIMEQGGRAALQEASRFFMREGSVYKALDNIAARLDALGIPYTVAGGMALFNHGYRRFTEDVDILVTREGLQRVHEHLDGLGYVPPFKGSKNLRDTENDVRIEFLISGDYPGDGKPKPVAFPQPDDAAVEIDGIRYLSLPHLVELKLASGMSNALRLRDISDVVELIRILKLERTFAERLNAYVRPKFLELWDLIAAEGPGEQ